MKLTRFFITGTDTSAGKTVVTSALIRYWQSNGRKVAGLKPIASGFELVDGEYRNEDIESITQANNVDLPPKLINRYHYIEAAAPHILAQHHKEVIDLDAIVDDVKTAEKSVDTLLVEGVGGWLVPLNGHKQDYQDIQLLAQKLNFPVILVVGMRLGCISHALLTAQSIVSAGVPFLGWVANFCEPEFSYLAENVEILDQRMPVPRLFDMPFCKSLKSPQSIIPINSIS